MSVSVCPTTYKVTVFTMTDEIYARRGSSSVLSVARRAARVQLISRRQ